LHSRCLGTLYRKIELLSSCLLAETPLAFRGLTKSQSLIGQVSHALARLLQYTSSVESQTPEKSS
jgi:hypothetical protein